MPRRFRTRASTTFGAIRPWRSSRRIVRCTRPPRRFPPASTGSTPNSARISRRTRGALPWPSSIPAAGRTPTSTSLAARVTYVVAAGNDSRDLASTVPAAYDEVLAVTAVADYNGQPGGGAAATCRAGTDDSAAADFSNFAGPADEGHTVAAPGVCVLSTWKGRGDSTLSRKS